MVCICSDIQNHILCDLRRGLRKYFPTLIQICNPPAPWILCACTQTGPLLCCTQTAPRACRHWQLPVVSFPQVPGVTQPLPDSSNHRQGLFHSDPREKAQRVPKEMSETHTSIALFFSSFLTLFWMHVWGLITVAGDEVDFTWPGSHQKEKSLHRDWKTQPCTNLEDCHAATENSREPNHTQGQNGENIWHSLLTAFQGLHHHQTAACCSHPAHAPQLPASGPLFMFFPTWDTLYQCHTVNFSVSFQPSPNFFLSMKFSLDDLF